MKNLIITIRMVAYMKYELYHDVDELNDEPEYDYLSGNIISIDELKVEESDIKDSDIDELYYDNPKTLEQFIQEFIDEIGYEGNNVSEIWDYTIDVLAFKKEGETYVYYRV